MTGPPAPGDPGASAPDAHGMLAPGDPGALALGALARFLRERDLCDGSLSVTRIGDGHSNLTYAVSDGQRTVVVRRPPPPPAPAGGA